MWEDLELDPEKIPTFKLVFHSLQIVLAFVLWCLEIAVFRADQAKITGNNGWTFAVVSQDRQAQAPPTPSLQALTCTAPFSSFSQYPPGSTS